MLPIAPSRPMVAYIPYVSCTACHRQERADMHVVSGLNMRRSLETHFQCDINQKKGSQALGIRMGRSAHSLRCQEQLLKGLERRISHEQSFGLDDFALLHLEKNCNIPGKFSGHRTYSVFAFRAVLFMHAALHIPVG